jgi:hypothetical protein
MLILGASAARPKMAIQLVLGPRCVLPPRPPIPLDTIVSRTHLCTYAANVWDLSIVQGPFSVAPSKPERHDSQLFLRCGWLDVSLLG